MRGRNPRRGRKGLTRCLIRHGAAILAGTSTSRAHVDSACSGHPARGHGTPFPSLPPSAALHSRRPSAIGVRHAPARSITRSAPAMSAVSGSCHVCRHYSRVSRGTPPRAAAAHSSSPQRLARLSRAYTRTCPPPLRTPHTPRLHTHAWRALSARPPCSPPPSSPTPARRLPNTPHSRDRACAPAPRARHYAASSARRSLLGGGNEVVEALVEDAEEARGGLLGALVVAHRAPADTHHHAAA